MTPTPNENDDDANDDDDSDGQEQPRTTCATFSIALRMYACVRVRLICDAVVGRGPLVNNPQI